MQNFTKINNLVGWAVFLIATAVYALTVEPTASYWDCGEFIAVSYKLEVPHPPGAPLFLLIGRFFSLFAGSEETVALAINYVSVISSGFTILFLYWSIVLLGMKMLPVITNESINNKRLLSTRQAVMLMGSGLIGALAYTFSDSFWFSAVEAEVYAMSSFFMAIVVWMMLKWELIVDRAESNKWLILIAFVMGLSIGVHLLNLVAFPALAILYYYKRYPEHTLQGFIIAFVIGLIIVGIIMVGIIPGLPSIAGWLEIMFVNSLGLPFNSGVIFFWLLALSALIAGIYWSQKKGNELANVSLLSLAFILIGYSSYIIIPIRSNFNPPIDENNPENSISFVSYLKREQYGDRPLLYGPYFTAELEAYEKGAPVYRKGKEKYEIASYKSTPKYSADSKMTILPRAYSTTPQHQQLYRQRMALSQYESPNFVDNIAYMFSYQLGHMYWRYFGWNFIGRDSDIKDAGVLTPLNAGEDLPEILETNKGRNNFWALPFLLGVAGFIFQLNRDKTGFWFTLALFFLSGAALVLYLNSPPIEPRERDYIYVGSFYVFAMWIGFGVMAISEGFSKVMSRTSTIAPILATVLCLAVPAVMAAEGWDDHDRSDRYFSVDSARNFLASCAPNAILFTGGDNDTFPLWYVQEVEGFRTDVRVIVLTYFNTDWYIDQMKMKMNESEPLPISLTEENYKQGGLNDVLYYVENPNVKGALPLEQYIKLVRDGHPAIRVQTRTDEVNTIPSKNLSLNIDRQKLLSSGIIPKDKEDLLVDRMEFKLKGSALEKNALILLDILVTNNWERPIYFNNTSLQSIGLDLTEYVLHEGTTYRLLPVRNPQPKDEMVNTEVMYNNLMNNFYWRELDNPEVYYSKDYRDFVANHRSAFNTLGSALIAEGNTERAKEVINHSLEVMPDEGVPFDYVTVLSAQILADAGDKERALELGTMLGDRAVNLLTYLVNNPEAQVDNELQKALITLQQLTYMFADLGDQEKATYYQQQFTQSYDVLRNRF
jgi:hypothetical protein